MRGRDDVNMLSLPLIFWAANYFQFNKEGKDMVQLYSDIKGNGPPTNHTPGAVGQFYVDHDTGIRYECVEAFVQKGYKFNSQNYKWEERGIDTDFLATDAEVAKAVDDLRDEISGGGAVPSEGVAIWAELVE